MATMRGEAHLLRSRANAGLVFQRTGNSHRPLVNEEHGRDRPMIRPQAKSRSARLLIVDDHRDFAANLAELAQQQGFVPRVVHDLAAAREALRGGEYEVAVLDHRLPDGRGLDLIDEAHETNPELVPILIAAFASVETTVEALNHGAFAFVTKDADPEVLLDALVRAAESSDLRRENRRLRGVQAAILASLPDQLLLVDHDLMVQNTNQRHPLLSPRDAEPALPCPLVEFFSAAVRERLDWPGIVRSANEGVPAEGSFTIRSEAAGSRFFSVRVTRLPSVDAPLTLIQLSDLTERVELVRKLTDAEGLATIGRLVAIIAHELRNPLTGIRALAQMLRKSQEDTDPAAESVDEILALTGRMSATLADLLSYSRPREWREERVGIRELCERLVREGRRWPACEGRSLDLQLELDDPSSFGTEGDAQVFGEKDRLFSALSNLVENALQATLEGGKVLVRARRDRNAMVEIAIEDSGPGIPEDLRSRVLEPFFTTKKGGTGLGLSIVKATIDRHGGTIAVSKSERLGGSSFTIRLPCAARA
jgi:signal transduction histidine kinase